MGTATDVRDLLHRVHVERGEDMSDIAYATPPPHEAETMPPGGAGVVFNESYNWHEVWAFGRIVWRLDNLLYRTARIPLRESFAGARDEPDEKLRHVRCTVIALEGMHDVGGWKFVELPRNVHLWRYPLPDDTVSTAHPASEYPWCEILPFKEAICELRRARFFDGSIEFEVGRASETRTVYYHAPRRVSTTKREG